MYDRGVERIEFVPAEVKLGELREMNLFWNTGETVIIEPKIFEFREPENSFWEVCELCVIALENT